MLSLLAFPKIAGVCCHGAVDADLPFMNPATESGL